MQNGVACTRGGAGLHLHKLVAGQGVPKGHDRVACDTIPPNGHGTDVFAHLMAGLTQSDSFVPGKRPLIALFVVGSIHR